MLLLPFFIRIENLNLGLTAFVMFLAVDFNKLFTSLFSLSFAICVRQLFLGLEKLLDGDGEGEERKLDVLSSSSDDSGGVSRELLLWLLLLLREV